MQLSKFTLEVLSNLHRINQGLVFNPGKILTTVSEDKSVYVEANIEEEIPLKFAIYDIGQFVSNISELEEPELSISDTHITIVDKSGMSVDYICCVPDLVIAPNNKKPPDFMPTCSFDLSWSIISKLTKMASINQITKLFIEVVGGNLSIGVMGNDSNNKVKVSLGNTDSADTLVKIDINNLKLLQGDYKVDVNGTKFVKLQNTSGKSITYVVAMLAEDM